MARLSRLFLSSLLSLCLAPQDQNLALATGDESVLAAEIGRQSNESLFWGPYKPNLYFGVRPRTPKGLWAGLMWSKVEDYSDLQHGFRYTCEQHEGLRGYGWDEYDARTGGIQTLHDQGNAIDITTSFVKVPLGGKGGSWAVRVRGEPRLDAPDDLKTMVFLYLAQDSDDAELEVSNAAEGTKQGFAGDARFRGASSELGEYSLVVTQGTGAHPDSDDDLLAQRRHLDKMVVQSLLAAEDDLWKAKGIVYTKLQESVRWVQEHLDQTNLPAAWHTFALEHHPGSGNVHVVQRMFQGGFEFDVIFSSASAGAEMTSEDVTREIGATRESFAERFRKVFAYKGEYAADKYLRFGKSMFSNLLGGIGYFHGYGLADRSYAPEYEEESEGFWVEAAEARARNEPRMEGPYELFTSIPSRPFFPRGFLWDEGFHLIPIADWDMDLALEIVRSWFGLMDQDGWIAREQILGAEARSKVPDEFQVQYPHYANPPTLFLIVDMFVDRLRKYNGSAPGDAGESIRTAHVDNTPLGEDYLRRIYPLLRRQHSWFRRTQAGDIKSYDREAFSSREAYRWRGRTETHVLTSGLDDYPRPQPPHPGELHVDLMSWMGMMTKSLANIADALGMAEDADELRTQLGAIERNLEDLHWSEKEGCYCDATIDDFEEHALVCHKGYVSLFPFLVGLMPPDHPRLGSILDLMGDEEQLFSPHGLRSLSKSDELYGTGENYWRSPVWVNINYMAITQLYNLAVQDGKHKSRAADLYTRLRKNVIDTIFKSWEETGFAWEQYNPETGEGQRTQHFTGWTSLVVKLMAMEDVPGGAGSGEKDEL